ncbi:hypothetical protein KY290_025752 [Solanum tuberosum]|uniref:Ribosomal protein L10e/L16 domain-containing protein n=1 Tax=Solanum tuberosum TaxID=4113 RepID=A0ABQ7UWL0_SOLTU|nr:hypothetical protein KY289_024811 [Solanum tuberosum]KAH0676785.1 hypothetical protein KY285_024586 [Solanum tuberosum]KAH0755482.1 hypothetical protein KY290_025752 [Solanum tuberosum]
MSSARVRICSRRAGRSARQGIPKPSPDPPKWNSYLLRLVEKGGELDSASSITFTLHYGEVTGKEEGKKFPEALEIQTGSENHSRYLALRSANKEVIQSNGSLGLGLTSHSTPSFCPLAGNHIGHKVVYHLGWGEKLTGKPTEVRMGRGKGNPTGWIARVSRGQILVSI